MVKREIERRRERGKGPRILLGKCVRTKYVYVYVYVWVEARGGVMIPILHICLSCCFSYKKVVFWPFDPGHIIYWGVCV